MSHLNISTSTLTVSSLVIDDLVVNSFRIINLMLAAETIGLFGIVANVVNIRLFRKLGYQDGVNITLTALAVSDIGALLFLEAFITISSPWLQETDLLMLKSHLLNLCVYFRGYFVRTSSLITSFATFERCLCVVLPLRVKSIFTTRVVVMSNLTIFIVILLYLLPQIYISYIDWKFIPELNKNIMALYYRPNRESVLSITYYFTDLFLPYGTFAILIVCSTIICLKIKSKSKWRQSIASGGYKLFTLAYYKERKSASMLLSVSIITVVCLLPQSVLFTAIGVIRELKIDGAYRSVTNICYSLTTLLETLSCSLTVFVYYKMSSRFREEFKKYFFEARK